MTEKEWLKAQKFDDLYDHVKKSRRCTKRVRFLLAAALSRRIAHLYPDSTCLEAIELIERIADGEESARKLPAMHARVAALTAGTPTTTPTDGDWPGEPYVEVIPTEALGVVYWLTHNANKSDAMFGRVEDLHGLIAAQRAKVMPNRLPYEAIPDFWNTKQFEKGKAAEERQTCALLRDVFGNPFRKVKFDKKWRTDTVTAIAKQMYESRDSGAMPILGDALQDAGCDNDDILSHCRDAKQVHVRGCWVVDLVLNKS